MYWLNNLLNDIANGKVQTRYSHDNRICTHNNVSELDVDCSGLVELWLKNSHNSALAEVYHYINKVRDTTKYQINRLYSFDFYDFFNSAEITDSPNWRLVDVMQKLQCGDVLAMINPQKSGRWGHVAIVAKEISRTADKICLDIIDSSNILHYNDKRNPIRKGIGRGNVDLLLQNENIVTICYNQQCQKVRAIKIARLRDINIKSAKK